MSIENLNGENHDPEFVQRANGRLIFVTAIVGMVFFATANAYIATFGVPFGSDGGAGQAQAELGQTSGKQQSSGDPSTRPSSDQQATSGQATGSRQPPLDQPAAGQKAERGAPGQQPQQPQQQNAEQNPAQQNTQKNPAPQK